MTLRRAHRTESPPASRGSILRRVAYYLRVLDAEDLPLPHIVLAHNVGARVLGVDTWRATDPTTTTMTLQRVILGHPRTLDRVVAHETIHHVDALRMTAADRIRWKMGFGDRTGHGPEFLRKAAIINAVLGDPQYVTVTSDQGYEQAKNTKPYLMIILPLLDRTKVRKYGYAWGVRLSPKASGWVVRKITENGARLVRMTGDRWLHGPRIKEWASLGVPKSDEDQAALAALYDRGRVDLREALSDVPMSR